MSDFFKSGKFKIILCMIALLVGIMLYSVTRQGETLAPSSIVSEVFNPIRQAINSLGDNMGFSIKNITNAKNFEEENQELKEQVADLQKQLIEYESAKSELEELRKFVGIKKEHPNWQYSAPCNIVGRVTNDPYGAFIIKCDANDDIELYDPVVTAEGLVGIVTEISDNYATVKTLLSPDVSVGSVCIKSKDTGLVQGNMKYAKDGLCEMVYVSKSNKIEKDELVVTSGNSGRFPQDYIIGTVQEVAVDESGLSSYAVIKPAVDSRTVSSVVVITYFDGQGDSYED